MAEVNAKDLTTKTAPASTDSMLLFGTTTNEGAKITVDNLANNILERLATKTFPNQVGGSSAATILAQLATLNSNSQYQYVGNLGTGIYLFKIGRIRVIIFVDTSLANITYPTIPEGHRPVYNSATTIHLIEGGTYKRYLALANAKTDGTITISHFDSWGGTSLTTVDPEDASGWLSGQLWYISSL